MAFLLGSLNVAVTESIQKSINEEINRVVVNNTQGCSSSVGQSVNITGTGEGTFTLGESGVISQESTVDMTCVLRNSMDVDFRNKLKQTLVENVNTTAEGEGVFNFNTTIASSTVIQDSLNRLVNSFDSTLEQKCGSAVSQEVNITKFKDVDINGTIQQGAASIMNCDFTNDLIASLANDIEQELTLDVTTSAKSKGLTIGAIVICISIA